MTRPILLTQDQVRNARDLKAATFAFMPANAFLKLTTPSQRDIDHIRREALPYERYVEFANTGEIRVPAFLKIDIDSGKVIGHEGRHRIAAKMQRDGYTTPVPVAIIPAKDGYAQRAKTQADLPALWEGQFRPTYFPIDKVKKWATPRELIDTLEAGGFRGDLGRAPRLLWRAADHPIVSPGAHLSENREDAEQYLDNPGFGGHTLLQCVVSVNPEAVLNVTGGPSKRTLEKVADAISADAEAVTRWWGSGFNWVFQLLENTNVESDLRTAGFEWIVFSDDFPEGSTTWKYLDGPPIRCRPIERASNLGRAPRLWWKGPIPRKVKACYPTKQTLLRLFIDENRNIIENYGGIDYQVSPAEFDAINHKYDLTGREAARSIADAVWAALPPQPRRKYCFEDIDLAALNDTSPVREAGISFRLPDAIEEQRLSAQEAQWYREQYGVDGVGKRKPQNRSAALGATGQVYVGLTWESPQGQRTVVGERAGLFAVRTEGRIGAELHSLDDVLFEMRRDAANLKTRRQAGERRRAEEARHKEASYAHGFYETMTPTQAARAKKTLEKTQGFNRKIMRRKDAIEQMVAEGWRVQGNRLVSPTGSYFEQKDITKTALDYAQHLTQTKHERGTDGGLGRPTRRKRCYQMLDRCLRKANTRKAELKCERRFRKCVRLKGWRARF